MRKIEKRVFAAVLAAALLFTMPGMASYAEAEDAQTEDADLSRCKGEKTENSSEENKEDAGQEDTGAQDDNTNLCTHHKEHTKDCGYSRASEDGEGSLCTYECRICPIEGLIAALPDEVTEDNAKEVRAQLNKILALYRELTVEEQEQIDISRCLELQEALDAANAPTPIEEPSEDAVAMVEKEGEEPSYVTSLADAFVTGNSGAKITLLANVDIGETGLTVLRDTNFTLDCGNFTLSGGDDASTLQVNSGGVLTFVGGTVRGTGSGYTVNVLGTFTMSGGVLDSTSAGALLVNSTNNVHVTVTGGTVGVSGIGLYVNDNSKATIALSGGTYSSINPGREGTYGNYTYRPVSSVLADGYALKGADGFIRGDATKTQYNVTVVECTHDGAATPNEDGATHGGECPYCGTEFEAAPHTLGADNKCEGCKTPLVASVKIGNATTYYGGIEPAWTAACAAESATVTLLANVTASSPLMVDQGDDITFDGGSNTLSIMGFSVGGGQLDITGGIFEMSHMLQVSGGTVRLSGGTFRIGSGGGITCSSGVASLLLNYGTETEPHYAYFDAQDNPIPLEGKTTLTGTVTVKECDHKGIKVTPNNDGTHSLKCPYCGYTRPAANCSYGNEYKHDDTNHWQTCTACGYENKVMHDWELKVENTNNVTKHSQGCSTCKFEKYLFTVTIIVPDGLIYGQTGGKQLTCMFDTEKTYDHIDWELTNEDNQTFNLEADGTLPADLPAGEYQLYAEGKSGADAIVFYGYAKVTVSRASLTAEMVEPIASVTYSGAEQKPTITVKQGGTTLVKGADYDVTYSTNDFTNVGTITVTITGKGNYKGMVEKTYTIKKAVLAADGSGTANGTYGAKLSELSVTGLKAVYQGTTTEVSGTWKLTGNTIPDVGDSGKYTATFTPDSGAGNYESLTAQVTLNIAKAVAPVLPDGTLYVQNGRAQSYQYDLTQLLPALNNGKSFGTINYTLEADAVKISEGYYAGGAEITGTTLTLPIKKAENENTAGIGTVSITITSRNYKDMTAMINIESVNKAPVTITGVSVAGREYNGKAIDRTGTPGAAESDGSTATISSDAYQYTWKNADGTVLDGAPKDAGSYQLIVSVDNDTYIGSRTISFVIDKARITVTADSMTAGKGSEEPALTYKVSGLAAGETLAAEPTLVCSVDMNTVGRYPITASGAAVPDIKNYHPEITYVPGTLTVTVITSGGSSSSGGSGSSSGSSGGSGNASDGNVQASGNTGAGNKVRPGNGTGTGSSTVQKVMADTGIPFIKGEDGKIGWDVIRAEEEKAEEGSVINIDMNGTTVVPGDIFDSIKDRDITVTFDMGDGILWSVDGKSVTRDASRDKADSIDFTVRTGGRAVPAEIVNSCFANNVTGEHYSIQLSLAYDGEFGFTAVLSINLGKENAGFIASLYYYNEDAGELEFICADEVAEDGTVSIAFTHASDYVIVVDREAEEESDVTEPAQPERTDQTAGNGTEEAESPQAGQPWRTWWLVVIGILVIVSGTGIFFVVRKRRDDES